MQMYAHDEEPRELLYLSTPEQIAALTAHHSDLIGGVVSPLSGQPVLREIDLVAKGAQEVNLRRVYLPFQVPQTFPKHRHCQVEYDKKFLYDLARDHYKGWQFFPHIRLQWTLSSRRVRLADPRGVTLDFLLSGPQLSQTTLASHSYGISNVSGEEPSGKHDSRNTRISYDEPNGIMTVAAPDGTMRVYRHSEKVDQNDFFLLEKEILPNGKRIRYSYNEKRKLCRVESLDPQERNVYASLRIEGSPWEERCHFVSSSQTSADYRFEKRSGHWKIKDKIKKGGKYELESRFTCPPILSSVSSPFYEGELLSYEDQFLLSARSGKNDLFKCEYQGFGGGDSERRIQKLQFPVGPNGAYSSVYELSYQHPLPGKKEGVTTVRHCDGVVTVYHISSEFLIQSIQDFNPGGVLNKEKLFSWDQNRWLSSVTIRDGQQQILSQRSFEYDRFGNPIVERLTGDLTGDGKLETYTTYRAFSDDGKNLLLSEESEDGKKMVFSYLTGTDLVTAKWIKDRDQIVVREFYLYDDCNNLIQEILDDGSTEDMNDLTDVSKRSITAYTLRQEAPFLHLPEWIEYKYLEEEEERLLKKHHFLYDFLGNVSQEEVYNSEEELIYTLLKTYNARGDVLSETNRLGRVATYAYDSKGKLHAKTHFSQKRHANFHYDAKGRLVEESERGTDGIVHASTFVFDAKDRVVQSSDYFQNSTYYSYDPVVSKAVRIEYPQMLTGDGQVIPVAVQSTYDSLGRELTHTDPNGFVTRYRYNAYGKITEIVRPSGAIERFRYEKNGQLLSHTDPDGLTIVTKRDILGRIIAQTYVSSEGEELCEERFTFQGFNLISETDKEGNVKTYQYDGAGRKTREEFCGRVNEYRYDSFGELTTICQYNDENTLVTHLMRDEEGRILEERKENLLGHTLYKISYNYDEDGNQAHVTRYIQGQTAIDAFVYDSFGRLIEHQDAESHVTRVIYDEQFTNLIGQKVLRKETVDPAQVTTIESFNAHQMPIRIEVQNAQGIIMACREMRQDPAGNLLYRRDQVCEKELFRDIQALKYTYTPDRHIETLTRAWGGKEPRVTSYTYTPSGKIQTKTLPDGIVLHYTYYPLGFVSRLGSSDVQINHSFEYNHLGHLMKAWDDNQGICIEREVDPFGNVKRENFPKGFGVTKTYDAFDRILSLKMATQGEVLYSYDPLYLRAVTRISNLRGVLYMHTYKDYDWDGNLVTESLVGNIGDVVHTTDLKGQIASISSPFYSQEYLYDPSGKLINAGLDRSEHLQYYERLPRLVEENNSDPFTMSKAQQHAKTLEMNDVYELLNVDAGACSYDLNKNQIVVQTPTETFCFLYDPLNRVTEVSSETKKVSFTYDPLGRRLSKVVFSLIDEQWVETLQEHYLYHGQHEIGIFNQLDQLKNLRVLGLTDHKHYPNTVCVELEGHIFAPLLDAQGNIRRLINLNKKWRENGHDYARIAQSSYEAVEGTLFNPWSFASMRIDAELGPVYFAKRLYHTDMGRWVASTTESVLEENGSP
jgi:YD repeat-containing protein